LKIADSIEGVIEMGKQPDRQGKEWTAKEVLQLRDLARQNTPTRVIGIKLERTPEAVQQKASEKGISLKPTNQSPYNRRRP
jgi:hypothetical protein